MGQIINGAHVVDVEYDSYFLMLTKVFDGHRLSARYDNFDITQNDNTREDNNPENGFAWTASYQYSFSVKVALATE
jgi:hypothetical protein